MAITTNSSIRVKPSRALFSFGIFSARFNCDFGGQNLYSYMSLIIKLGLAIVKRIMKQDRELAWVPILWPPTRQNRLNLNAGNVL
jgi:hypothetical protein